MTLLKDIATIQELAARLNKSESDALAILNRLKVPVVDGVFSERLMLARLEGAEAPTRKADPCEPACAHLERLGFEIQDVDSGRPTVVRLGASVPLLIGSPEFETGPEEGAFARILLSPGEHLHCIVQVAARRPTRTADFNVTFDRTRKIRQVDLYAFYLVSEGAMWLLKRAELEAFRSGPRPDSESHKRESQFAFYPLDPHRNTWRISFGKGLSDFSAEYRVHAQT
jgi:hypothetical protein